MKRGGTLSPEKKRMLQARPAPTFQTSWMMINKENQHNKKSLAYYIGIGVALGAGLGTALGVALGTAFGNITMGVAFGPAFGVSVGAIVGIVMANSAGVNEDV